MAGWKGSHRFRTQIFFLYQLNCVFQLFPQIFCLLSFAVNTVFTPNSPPLLPQLQHFFVLCNFFLIQGNLKACLWLEAAFKVEFLFVCLFLTKSFLSPHFTVCRSLFFPPSFVLTSVSCWYWSLPSVSGDQVLPVSHWLPMEAESRCIMGRWCSSRGESWEGCWFDFLSRVTKRQCTLFITTEI